MSDSNPTPPPRPKPGSLRDRIAAFERPSQAAQVPGPPPPRTKPVGVQWRPKQQQQQQQQQQTEDGDGQDQSTQSSAEGVPPSTPGVSSMSASDARNSIKQGGSLKERMAALQGRGAFGGLGGGGSGGGASAPKETSPPPPPTQKPKWKPPPQVSFIPAEGEESPAPARESVEEDKDKREEVQTETEENPAQDQEHQEQVDPEEEERQRRATIAARMAKLGGARVGMAPPGMFGGARPPPPVAKKPEALRVPTAKESEAQAGTLPLSPPPPPSTVPGAEEVEEASLLIEPGPGTGTGSDAGSPTPSHSRSPPPSMPAPAVPRRTAPPRRKPPKSPVPPPPEVEPEASLIEAESVPLATQVTEEHLEVLADVEPLTKEERREVEVQPVEEVGTMQDLVGDDAHDDTAREVEVVEEPEQQQPEEEVEVEDVETRRKRIAERIAKMGAINPLAPPPISRGSVSDEVEVGSPPASASVRRSSIDSVSSVKSGGLAKRSSIGSVASPPMSATAIRRSSVDSISSLKSVSSPTGMTSGIRKRSVDSVKEAESAPIKDAAVVGGIPEQDERAVNEDVPEEEQIQEEEEEGSNDALAASMILERPPPPNVIEQEAHETVPVPAPPVDRSSRPSSDDPQTEFGTRPSVHQRRSSGYVTRPPQSDDSREHDNHGSIEQTTDIGRDESGRASPPPLPISPRTGAFVPASLRTRRFAHDEDEDDEEEEEDEVEELRPLPVPHRTSSVLSSRHALKKEPDVYEEDRQEDQEQEEDQVKHVPPPPTRKVPLPPPSVTPVQAESESPVISADSTPAAPVEQEQQEALEPGSAHSDAPLVIPPPASERRLSKSAASDRPLPHPMSFRQSKAQVEVPQLEIMDDEEGDPIDPSIHVPRRSPGRSTQVAVPAPPPPPAFAFKVDPQEEAADPNAIDMDAARRSTIAERMAKLGGIKFGAAPPVPVARLSSVPAEEASEAEGYEERKEEVGEGESVGGEEEKKEVDEEEEERARKERIAAKLAGMGGMRIGMMPATMGFPPRPPQRPAPPPQVKEEPTPVPPPPPPVAPRARPPPPPQPQEAEWERDSASNSEDGVKVDMEESDMEEVNYEDARTDEDHKDHEDGEMVVPPPPPRVHSRPPVPSTSNIRSSTLGRKSSSGSTTTTKTASTSPQRTRGNYDFVMVDEPQDAGEEEELEDVPPPPARPLQRRLTREAPSHPPPHPPQQSMSDSISSQWELPVIPSGGLGLGADLSMSWTETDELAATLIPPTHAPPLPPSIDAHSAMHPTTGQRLSSDELNAVWKRVGVQVCEAAMQLYEKSKKTVVGDGTYAGFVHAVLNEVPNAAKPPVEGHHEWGYLVYAQTGSAVQKRLSEIMSGDVVEFIDARFKGHKSPLQTYSQHVGGAGEPVVGVVASEVEPKKTKVKVVQANQHVGQQTVESVSYRLEDLKSGTVKVYRILEA